MYATVASQICSHIIDSSWDYSNKQVLRLGHPEILDFLTRRAYHLDAHQVAWFPLHACAPLEDSWWKRRRSQAMPGTSWYSTCAIEPICWFRSSNICHRNNEREQENIALDTVNCAASRTLHLLKGFQILRRLAAGWKTYIYILQTVSHLQPILDMKMDSMLTNFIQCSPLPDL